MRTTVIPAQITTVEDKIIGNLTIAQIILLLIPTIWAAIVYTVLPPVFLLTWYKVLFFLLILVVCLTLCLRIKGKIILHWVNIILRFNLRPRYYIFDKNDATTRELYLPEFKKAKRELFRFSFRKEEIKKGLHIPAESFSEKDLIKLKDFLYNPKYSVSVKPDQKGVLYVTLEQIK